MDAITLTNKNRSFCEIQAAVALFPCCNLHWVGSLGSAQSETIYIIPQ